MNIKISVSTLGCILFSCVILLPFATLFFSRFGYTFEITNISVYVIAVAFLSICTLMAKGSVENRSVKVLFALLAPLSFIHAVFCMFKCCNIWVILGVSVCVGSCLFLTVKHGKPIALKVTAFVLSALLILPYIFFSFLFLIFGNIGKDTVVQSVTSPNGVYCAELIDSDQGALGGDTLVVVHENYIIDGLVFEISKNPQLIYRGEWGEFKSMNIRWKDDNCLLINSVEHEID